jgi:CelD/BcsL family acetyltransferase involved in cellulose biosynthesis
MQVVRVRELAELERLRSQWDRLGAGVPFRSRQWLGPWWRHYGRGRELYVLAVRDDRGVTRGLVPWMRESSVRSGRVLRFLGSGEACSDYLSVLSRPDDADAVAAAVADWLTTRAHDSRTGQGDHRWDLLELSGVDAADQAVQRLVAHLRSCGNAVHCRPGPNCWRIALPATWEEYLAGLSKSHRKKLRRLERNGLSACEIRSCSFDGTADTQQGMQVLVDLHQRRRRQLGEAGCFSSDFFSRFLHEAAAAMAAKDQLELYWLERQGEPIAAEFQLLSDTTVYAYQAGMDPQRLDLQPGRLSCMVGIQKALSAGRTAFDFLRGDEPYKAHWGATARPGILIRAVPRKPLALARHLTWLAGRQAKQAIKGGLTTLGVKGRPSAERGRDSRRDADRKQQCERSSSSHPAADRAGTKTGGGS